MATNILATHNNDIYALGKTQMTVEKKQSYPTFLSELDLHLFNEGSHERIYEKLGGHIRTVDGVVGVNFSVWAPNAKNVSVVGGFNCWNKTQHPMEQRIPSGIWELFVPGLKAGETYKYLSLIHI